LGDFFFWADKNDGIWVLCLRSKFLRDHSCKAFQNLLFFEQLSAIRERRWRQSFGIPERVEVIFCGPLLSYCSSSNTWCQNIRTKIICLGIIAFYAIYADSWIIIAAFFFYAIIGRTCEPRECFNGFLKIVGEEKFVWFMPIKVQNTKSLYRWLSNLVTVSASCRHWCGCAEGWTYNLWFSHVINFRRCPLIIWGLCASNWRQEEPHMRGKASLLSILLRPIIFRRMRKLIRMDVGWAWNPNSSGCARGTPFAERQPTLESWSLKCSVDNPD